MLMQNFGVTNKEHYGMLRYFLEWSIPSVIMPSRDVTNFRENGKSTLIGLEYKALLAKRRFRSLIHIMAVAEKQCDHEEIFESTLQNVFPTFGLTELKDEQKKTLWFCKPSNWFLQGVCSTLDISVDRPNTIHSFVIV